MALDHAQPGEAVRLASLSRDHGTALVKTEQFEAIHLVVRAGAKLAPHSVAGEFTLQCLTGRASSEALDIPTTNAAATIRKSNIV